MSELEAALPQELEQGQSFLDSVHNLGERALDIVQSGSDWLSDRKHRFGAYAAAGTLSVLGLAGTATEAQASTIKPITPKKLEQRVAYWFNNLQAGATNGGMPDKSSIVLKPHRYVAKEPCDAKTYGFIHLYRATYSGVYDSMCVLKGDTIAKSGFLPRSTLQWTPLYNINLTPLLDKQGEAAAESINVPAQDYGNTTKVEVTDFGRYGKVNYAPSDTPYVRHLKEASFTDVNGHVSYHTEWYK